MDVTLSQKALHDITILRDPEWTRRPGTVELGEYLETFLEAIDVLNSVNTTIIDDGQNLGLADAAYALNNMGFVWSRQVDEIARLAQQTMECLDDLEARRHKSTGTEEANKSHNKRSTVHPLTFPSDDSRKAAASILPLVSQSKIPPHKNLLSDIPQITADQYLAPNEPRTLQLMDCEKIRSYFDDRGNKGHDWAEYQINVIRLNKEGYYPLELGGGYKTSGHRRYTFSIMPEIVDTLDGEVLTDSFDAGDKTAIQLVTEQLSTVKLAEENSTIPSDRSRKVRQNSEIILKTIDFAPHRHIVTVLQQKKLVDIVSLPEVDNLQKPYKRRCKRKIVPKDIDVYGMEVEFFKYFWNVETGEVNIKFVLDRFSQRLHEQDVPEKKTRGRKPPTAVKKVHFISMTPAEGAAENTEPVSLEIGKSTNEDGFSERAESEVGMGTLIDRAADYLDTDEPCGDETLINLNTNSANDLCGAFHRLNFTQINPNHHDTQFFNDLDKSDAADVSLILDCDLHEWECRLEQFLGEHEPATAKFSLEDCGQQIVKEYKEKKNGVGMMEVIGMKRTSGEVSQAFLSVLDLVNKDVIKLDVVEKDKSRAKDADTVSQDASKCALRILGKAR